MRANGKVVAVLAAFFLPCTGILAQTNDARYLGDTIPANMIPGFTYNVAVTFKNTGTTTWTGGDPGGYVLWCTDGYNFEVYHNEVGLGGSETIAPGQDKTFEMSFLAPSAGTYTTGWRVVQDGVGAFGDTCLKQVVVAFGPNIPGAPTINSPAPGKITGSNRPDIRFQGDPCDAYEVHIGSCNLPTSTDGWDSGMVWINSGPNELWAAPGVLNTQATYYVFARLHNTHGWGPWTASGDWFYTAGQWMNDPYLVSGGGLQWLHAMCYNPDRNEYLLTWQNGYIINYCRLDATGARIGAVSAISDDLVVPDPQGNKGGHHRSVVCYNSARKEYLIEYSGWTPQPVDEVRVLRVDAATGNPIGSPIWLYTTGIVFALQVAYSPTANSYLATWEAYSEGGIVYGRMLDTTAVPTAAAFRISSAQYLYCRNESIAWNTASDEYMVTFQGVVDEPHSFDYFGQRLRASDGSSIGSNFVITAQLGSEGPGGVAYDSDMNRYLVVYEGGEASPWGQFVSPSGALVGNRFPIGMSPLTGGMCNVTWNPVTKEYLATWAHCCSYNNFGQRVSQTGALVGEPFSTNGAAQGIGNWYPMSVANPVSGEFLIYWFCSYANIYTRRYKTFPLPPPDTQPPDPVTNLTVSRTPTGMSLSWTNPSSADFSGTMIRSKVGSPPSGPADGKLVVDKPNCPGSTDTFMDTVEPRGEPVCYAAFAHDVVFNYASVAATGCGTLVGGDFDGDSDVDQEDFGHLQACFSGSGVSPAPGCEDADLDIDGDVDQDDFAAFISCTGGANQTPGC